MDENKESIEVNEEVVKEKKNKKFVSITFDRTEDSVLIEKLSLITRITGMTNKEILLYGLTSNHVTEEFQDKIKLIQDLA